jgi:hypothetical protein
LNLGIKDNVVKIIRGWHQTSSFPDEDRFQPR